MIKNVIKNRIIVFSKQSIRPQSQFEPMAKSQKSNTGSDAPCKEKEYDSSNSDSVVSRNSINKTPIDVNVFMLYLFFQMFHLSNLK